jgi:hypothetical protein
MRVLGEAAVVNALMGPIAVLVWLAVDVVPGLVVLSVLWPYRAATREKV